MLKIVQGSTLSAIGNAIRTVKMSNTMFLPSEMPSEILEMQDWAFYRIKLHTIDNGTDITLSDMYVSVGSQPDMQSVLSAANSLGYVFNGAYRIGINGELLTGDIKIISPSDTDVYLDCTNPRIKIVQAHVQNYEIEYRNSGYTAVITFVDDTSILCSGFVFDTGGMACTISEQSRSWQYGTCTKTATLPTIISTGAERVSYVHNAPIASGAQITVNANVYCFAGMTSGMVNGSQVELTISILH